jgi:hypothetical protein
MIVVHLAYVVIDVVIFQKFFGLIFDAFYGWLAYYCLMTLNQCAIYAYIALLAISLPMGILGVFTMLFAGVLAFIFYPLQLLVYAYAAYWFWNFYKKDYNEGKLNYEYVQQHGELPQG